MSVSAPYRPERAGGSRKEASEASWRGGQREAAGGRKSRFSEIVGDRLPGIPRASGSLGDLWGAVFGPPGPHGGPRGRHPGGHPPSGKKVFPGKLGCFPANWGVSRQGGAPRPGFPLHLLYVALGGWTWRRQGWTGRSLARLPGNIPVWPVLPHIAQYCTILQGPGPALGLPAATLGLLAASLGLLAASLGLLAASLGLPVTSLGLLAASLGLLAVSLGFRYYFARFPPPFR